MMKTSSYPVKTYDSVEYGILLPDDAVKTTTTPIYKQKKRMSCPKCLCLTLLLIVATLVVTSIVGALCGYFWMKKHVRRFTTDKSRSFPIHELPDSELEIVKDRVKLFYDTILAGQVPEEDLVVTQDEINAFVAHSEYLRGNAIVHLTENTFSTDMSLPAKFLPGGKGRFFVGTGSLTLAKTEDMDQTKLTTELQTSYDIDGLDHPKLLFAEFLAYVAKDGTNTMEILSGQFYNWVAPEDCIEKHENLLQHLCDDDDDKDDQDCRDLTTVLNGLQDVSITDQKITFHARSMSASGQDEHHRRRLSGSKVSESSSSSSSYGSYARRALTKMMF